MFCSNKYILNTLKDTWVGYAVDLRYKSLAGWRLYCRFINCFLFFYKIHCSLGAKKETRTSCLYETLPYPERKNGEYVHFPFIMLIKTPPRGHFEKFTGRQNGVIPHIYLGTYLIANDSQFLTEKVESLFRALAIMARKNFPLLNICNIYF